MTYVDCLLVENSELERNLAYWKSFAPGDNSGKLAKSIKLRKLTERLNEIAETTNRYFLEESSLSRIYQHVEANPNRSWGTLSAQRYSYSKKENEQRTEALKKELRRRGYGFIPLEGHWRECQDPNVPYDQCPEEQLVDSVETSFFVPNISRSDLQELGNQFEQDATIYGGPDTKNQAELVGKDGDTIVSLGRFKPNTIAQAFSRLKNGKPYVFADEPRPPKAASTPKTEPVDKEKRRAEVREKLKHRIHNPATGKEILVSTALTYDQDHPARKAAMTYLKK